MVCNIDAEVKHEKIWDHENMRKYYHKVVYPTNSCNGVCNKKKQQPHLYNWISESMTYYCIFDSSPRLLFYTTKYRKTPKISPWAYRFQRPFLIGLYTRGWAYTRRNIIVRKLDELIHGLWIYVKKSLPFWNKKLEGKKSKKYTIFSMNFIQKLSRDSL